MHFLISHVTISPFYLVGVGFVIGVLGGFFGVGGSFLAGPALFAAGMPMNFVVGTDLTHIVGKSIVASRKHGLLGNIDLKLAAFMVVGTLFGSETGVQLIELLKRRNQVNQVVGGVTIAVLLAISLFVAVESIQTLRSKGGNPALTRPGAKKHDRSVFKGIAAAIQRVRLAPMISLPHSGIAEISLWAILAVSFVGGLFSGFLGGGAGYIRMPCMVYLLGIPTHVAIGTDLFEIILSAGYGSFRHALKGNVDIMVALVMHTGAAIGAQIGATLTQYFNGPKIRLAFAPLPLIGAGLVIYGLLTGHAAR
jgi:uncharacterized membrane protein YfcA